MWCQKITDRDSVAECRLVHRILQRDGASRVLDPHGGRVPSLLRIVPDVAVLDQDLAVLVEYDFEVDPLRQVIEVGDVPPLDHELTAWSRSEQVGTGARRAVHEQVIPVRVNRRIRYGGAGNHAVRERRAGCDEIQKTVGRKLRGVVGLTIEEKWKR